MNHEINELIKQIAATRAEVDVLKEEQKAAWTQNEHTPEFLHYANVSVELANKDAEVVYLELMTKELVVKVYQETGEKDLHDAVGIRNVRKLEYHPVEALQFCWLNLYGAVKLDVRAFEKHAKAVEETAPLSFVKYSLEPQATIAGDLNEYLES
jgi:hypothetical protein